VCNDPYLDCNVVIRMIIIIVGVGLAEVRLVGVWIGRSSTGRRLDWKEWIGRSWTG